MVLYFRNNQKEKCTANSWHWAFTLYIELSISGRCRADIKELGNYMHEATKIHNGRIPCLENKYDLLFPTIYNTGAPVNISSFEGV